MYSVIQNYCSYFPEEAAGLLQQTQFLAASPDPFRRDLLPGHITGSGILIRDQKMLLIQHRYLKEWFQPGGHIDTPESPRQGAIREVAEETGWQSVVSPLFKQDLPIDIDIHIIPANPLKNELEHLHIDFAYLLEPVAQGFASDPETTAWVDLTLCTAARLARCVRKYHALKLA